MASSSTVGSWRGINGMLQAGGDGFGYLAAVKPSIFNEDFVGVHAGDDHTGQVNAGTLAFERGGIGARLLCSGIQRDSRGGEEVEVGTIADHGKNKIVL